ncbi:hypothetical protein B0H11DRAFT_2052752, partial [Mycena galericulata]
MLVCRSWYPRSSYLFAESLVCRPVCLVGPPDLKKVTCAVPYADGILYGTADGIYRTTEDGSVSRLFAIRDVSQIDILEEVNLFLYLAGQEFMSMPLDALIPGIGTPTTHIPLWRASFFALYRSTASGSRDRHRVCVAQCSPTS